MNKKVMEYLDKEDLENMVKGIMPNYNAMDHLLVKRCGELTGPHGDEWRWKRREVKKLSVEELIEVYKVCKESWEEDAQ